MRVAESVRQFGAFSRVQVFDAGGNDEAIRRHRRSGEWDRAAAGVYIDCVSPPCWEQRLWIAVLAVGRTAVVSHRSAAALWSFVGLPPGPIELTVTSKTSARAPGVVVSRSDDLVVREIRRHDRVPGLPVTSPERTIIDLGRRCTRPHLRLVLDEAIAASLIDEAQLTRIAGELSRRGKPGVRVVADLLAERGPGPDIAASRLERLLFSIIARAGLSEPVAQFPFPGRQAVQGCVDAAYPDLGVVVEADGRRWHSRRADFGRDRQRDNEAIRAGWVTLRFTWLDLRHDADGVATTIRETLDRRRHANAA